jgi:hypothetical protein
VGWLKRAPALKSARQANTLDEYSTKTVMHGK